MNKEQKLNALQQELKDACLELQRQIKAQKEQLNELKQKLALATCPYSIGQIIKVRNKSYAIHDIQKTTYVYAEDSIDDLFTLYLSPINKDGSISKRVNRFYSIYYMEIET